MQVELLRAESGLRQIIPEWNDLWSRSPWSTPFQTPEWLLPWWKTLGSGELFSFAVRDRGRLVGLAPMFLHRWNERRQVTFLGNGVSDYLDFIVDPDCAGDAAALIVKQIAAERDRWDICDFQDLPSGSEVRSTRWPDEVIPVAEEYQICMSMPLPADPGQFRSGLSSKFKANVRNARRRLDRLGSVSLETATEDQMEESFAALIRLHRARWAAKQDPGMIDGDQMARFHTQAAVGLYRRGIARLYVLKLNGAISAVVYLLVDHGRARYYLGGFDPALARFGLGALLLDRAIEQSILEGAREFDFLRGSENYKREWGARQRMNYRLTVTQDTQLVSAHADLSLNEASR